MRVRTIRDHSNTYGDSYFKSGSAGSIYEVADHVAKSLIVRGYVEPADKPKSKPKADGADGKD